MQRIPDPIRNLIRTTIENNPKMFYKDIAKTFNVSLSLVKLIAVEAKVNRHKGWAAAKAVVNG